MQEDHTESSLEDSTPGVAGDIRSLMESNHREFKLSAETVGGDDDLITQILLRVPVKSLLRFKSVSKGWQSLISGHSFARLYTLQNPNSVVSGLFPRRTPVDFQFLSLDDRFSNTAPFSALNFAEGPAGIKILQSCCGLFLCSSFKKFGTKRNYYIYNPTTNNFYTLPLFTDDAKTAVLGINLAFDPSQSLSYKVVCVCSTEKSMYFYQIHIYESEFSSWRLSGSPFVSPFNMVFDRGVFWNSAIHWISRKGVLFYFNLNNERFTQMPNLPVLNTSGGRRSCRYLEESSGYLHLIEISGPRRTQFKVFEMDRDYSTWFVKYEIDLEPILTAYPEAVMRYVDLSDWNYYAFSPLFLVRDENGIDAWLFLHVPGKVLWCNVRDKRVKQVFDCEAADGDETKKGSLQFGWLDAYPYFQSLVSVC